jgi:hypothetical protein
MADFGQQGSALADADIPREQPTMEEGAREQRKEPRPQIKAGAILKLHERGGNAHATTVNMSASGVLLLFEEPAQLSPGDQVTCDFAVSHDTDQPLPCWGVGEVLRVDGPSVAVNLKATGFSPLDSVVPALPERGDS